MKKLTVVPLVMLLLAVVLAVPASATAPTGVSGNYMLIPPPQNRVWRPAGTNCILDVDLNLGYTGDLVGMSTGHYRIVSHGPCEADGPVPYKHHETLKARGTFTGIVSGRSGSFDFTYEGKVWPAGPGELFLTARIVILSGTGELSNLHGWLDQAAVNGQAPTYSGQIHFDP